MQPLARSSHSVAVVEPWETVRDFSMSVVGPNSGEVLVGGVGLSLEGWDGTHRLGSRQFSCRGGQ